METAQVALTALLSAVSLFIIAKIIGHKQMAQLDFFDYITGITIGSIGAELATELEKPWKPLVAMGVYGLVAFTLSSVTRHFPKTRKYINGTPTILLDNGKLYRQNMKKAKLDLSEFMVMCRQQGYFDLSDIQTAVFEYNGQLTVMPRSNRRSAIPDDLNVVPPPASISTEVIMDGRMLGENLKRLGLDEKWLKEQLKKQAYPPAHHIYLCLCDTTHRLSVFEDGS